MEPVYRPHDALFRGVFGEPERAAELLRGALPQPLAEAIDWSSLQRQDGTFVDEDLKGQQADLLFEAKIGGEPALIYVLVEHKSKEERLAGLQVLGYVLRVLERWRTEHPDARALPPVVPVVLHHGKRPWRGSRRVRDLFAFGRVPEKVRRALWSMQVDLCFVLDDLAAESEERIRERAASVVTTLTLLFLRVLPRCDVGDAAEAILRWNDLLVAVLRHPRPEATLGRLYSYLLSVVPGTADELRSAFARVLPRDTEEPMRSAFEELMERSEEKGRAGWRASLLRQLEIRFGPLPESVAARVETGVEEELATWSERAVMAATLDEVFAE
jgi:hypothetical protein